MKYLIFFFKRRIRQRSLNNFLKLKKIRDIRIIMRNHSKKFLT
jgi:hypothetical protein